MRLTKLRIAKEEGNSISFYLVGKFPICDSSYKWWWNLTIFENPTFTVSQSTYIYIPNPLQYIHKGNVPKHRPVDGAHRKGNPLVFKRYVQGLRISLENKLPSPQLVPTASSHNWNQFLFDSSILVLIYNIFAASLRGRKILETPISPFFCSACAFPYGRLMNFGYIYWF